MLPALLLIAAVPLPAQAGMTRDRIFQPPEIALSLDGLPDGAAFLNVTTGDGLLLRGIAVPPRPGQPTLLIFHGNGSSASDALRWLSRLATRSGYGLVAAEYRGYSQNPGKPSEVGLTMDARAFYQAARGLAGNGKLLVIGHSLGAGVAIDLAKLEKLDALMTVGAFVSIPALAPKIARAFITDKFDNLAAVPSLDEPWFLVHGLKDDVIPPANGNTLHAAATRAHLRGASFVLADQGHAPDPLVMGRVIESAFKLLDGPMPTAVMSEPPITLVPFGATATVPASP
nr:alpha/beta hydrolase [Sphingobium nicotianae]